ncbi:MAG: uroporphyrinogen-III synthase [Flavobacteriia bacterium]
MTPRAIFISRSVDQIGEQLRQFEARGGTLYAQALIDFEGMNNEAAPESDVVFFSSIRAADFFFKYQEKPNALFACAGVETARKLSKQHQIECAFVSEEAGNPANAALAFKTWLKERTVLFPLSEQSLHTYSSLIPKAQKTELTVFRTLTTPVVIPPCDYYVFSSPSNVRAFLEVNVLPDSARCIAWGQSTEAALLTQQIAIEHCLKEGSVQELDAYFLAHVFKNTDQ